MTQTEALKLALEALELVSIEFVCNGAHHAKKDRHEWLDPCPIVDRYKEAITAIKAALANEALERKAENARELGLDYEPVAFASHGVLNWIADKQFQHEADLYTTSQRTWVGLTDEEIDYQAKKDDHGAYFALGALWAEAKLKEKNT